MSKQIAARTREKWVDDVKVIACMGHIENERCGESCPHYYIC